MNNNKRYFPTENTKWNLPVKQVTSWCFVDTYPVYVGVITC